MNIENEVIFGRIYKIYNIIDNKIYIGSTTQPLYIRLSQHLYDYKKRQYKIINLYTYINKIGIKNFKMKLLEGKVVDNMLELRQLEQKWINRENPINLLNIQKASANYEELKPIIEELIKKVFDIKLDIINDKA